MNSLRAVFAVFAFAILFTGCGKPLQKAGGKVAVDGVPVKDGQIMFYPAGGGRTASASIIEGDFTLSYEKNNDGLPPGKYKVTIVADLYKESPELKRQAEAMRAAAAKQGAIEDSSIDAAGGQLIHVVPPIYNTIETTPLTEEVVLSNDPQKFIYDIPSKGKKK